ncbi:MAG: hypothetical protein CML24_09785 [Rhizobiales bacterium]|nr:hypothetical protein [Hyphomicrobiales bacterium]|tara:strand:+ start:9250 stop:9456 length:207 start_codon:yes stop_codon:yes gene_type:complete
MTEQEQMHDVYLLCHRLRREARSPELRAAAQAVLDRGVAAVGELLEAAKGTDYEARVMSIAWEAWNRR